ncbi:MAG: hypothetical protein ACK4S4_13500 [Pyrinomonadaceae bacterium]
MGRTRSNQSLTVVLYSIGVLAVAALFLISGAQNNVADARSGDGAIPSATFPANSGTLGAIPDHAGTCQTGPFTPKDVTFTVSGLSGTVSNVNVAMTFGGPNHTWMGDVVATLIAPNGASHVIFGRTGATTATAAGDSSDLGAAYTFSDNAPSPPSGGWWQAATAAAATAVMPTGTYRTTASGGAGATNPMPPTNMNAAFSGVTNANGTWTLRFTDGCAGDTGAVSAATLDVTAGAVPTGKANVDINGDGKTDYVLARGTTTPLAEAAPVDNPEIDRIMETRGPKTIGQLRGQTDAAAPLAPPIFWYTLINGTGAFSAPQWGDAATDFLTPSDFDGDNKSDYTVWRPGAPGSATFYILQSATNTVRLETFGQTGDDPAVVGDYDGDGKSDPAVYRCPPNTSSPGQCFFFYRGSFNNPSGNVTYVPWGFGVSGNFFPLLGDFDGDGKNDFCIQRSNPSAPTQGQFVLLKSGGGTEFVDWGLSSDFLIPGDYDGDGKSDFCVRRTVSGARQHWVLTRTGATFQRTWGVTGDQSIPGDYDGDGKTDFAVWRPSATAGQSAFWIENSSNGSITSFPFGANGDFAVAGWAVH